MWKYNINCYTVTIQNYEQIKLYHLLKFRSKETLWAILGILTVHDTIKHIYTDKVNWEIKTNLGWFLISMKNKILIFIFISQNNWIISQFST